MFLIVTFYYLYFKITGGSMTIFEALQRVGAFFSIPFLYRKLEKERKPGETIVVLAPKFGDSVYAMLYVEEFKKETNRKIAVYCSEANLKYFKNYECVDRFITHKSNEFNQSRIFMGCWFKFLFKRKCLNKDIIYTVPPQYFYNERNSIDIYQNVVFSVKNDNKQLLKLKKTSVKSISDFEKNKDRIVVINSYSNSYRSKCRNILQNVANLLIEKGYIVYSNVVGKQKPLDNTISLHCPVDELFEICNHIRAFITIRSGIVDFVAGTNCEKYILYMHKKLLKYCSIASLNNNINEFEVLKKGDDKNFLEFVDEKFTKMK